MSHAFPLFANWLGVFAAILSAVSFSFAWRIARKMAWRKRILMAAVTGLLALPGLSFFFYYLHLTTEPVWYYEFRSWPGTELLIVFIGIAFGTLAAILPRPILALPMLACYVTSAVPFCKPFLGPFNPGQLSNQWEKQICLQSTPSTCGPASAATILSLQGQFTTERELAAKSHSYQGGTEAWYLARAIRGRGCRATFQFKAGFDPAMELPAIVGVRLGEVGHFIPILSRENGAYLIGDPLQGPEQLTEAELKQRYQFTGFTLVIGPCTP